MSRHHRTISEKSAFENRLFSAATFILSFVEEILTTDISLTQNIAFSGQVG